MQPTHELRTVVRQLMISSIVWDSVLIGEHI